MSWLLGVLLWLAIFVTVFKLYIKLTTGWCRSNVCLVGKTAIITGANRGIGYETAADFAKRGARVILACRDPTRGKEAAERIVKATDNPNIVFKPLDLSSFQSVREFAEDIKKTEDRVDILVNNAGAGTHGQAMGENGLLLLMQTNHYGHFLLTNLLLDLIKKTPNARIINVASLIAKYIQYIRGFDVDNLDAFPHNSLFLEPTVYARTKACNILFTRELAERLKGTSVTTYSLHPGAVLTDLFRKLPRLLRFLAETGLKLMFKDSQEGAQTSIYCSVAKGIESLSGEHFEDCHVVGRYKIARDPDLPKKLWELSEQAVKLHLE